MRLMMPRGWWSERVIQQWHFTLYYLDQVCLSLWLSGLSGPFSMCFYNFKFWISHVCLCVFMYTLNQDFHQYYRKCIFLYPSSCCTSLSRRNQSGQTSCLFEERTDFWGIGFITLKWYYLVLFFVVNIKLLNIHLIDINLIITTGR